MPLKVCLSSIIRTSLISVGSVFIYFFFLSETRRSRTEGAARQYSLCLLHHQRPLRHCCLLADFVQEHGLHPLAFRRDVQIKIHVLCSSCCSQGKSVPITIELDSIRQAILLQIIKGVATKLHCIVLLLFFFVLNISPFYLFFFRLKLKWNF